MLKNILPIGICRIVDRAPERKLDATRGQFVGDCARVWHRARQSIEFRHDERVTRSHGGERLIETGPQPVRAGQTAIGIDAVLTDAELEQRIFLNGEVLAIGGAAGIADERVRHAEIDT